ncbi:MAG: NUDIX hydrolase [Candidatus Gastranaerophilaceae bacterium]
MIYTEETIEKNTVFDGKVFEVRSDKSKLGNGEIQSREVVIHSGGVTIAAEKDDKIIFVKQFRYGSQQIMFELPAGKLDHGNEDVLSAAKRELEEETGYSAAKWTSLGYIYTSPAICSEKIYLFFAQNLLAGMPHPDEGEFVDFLEIEKSKVFEMIKTGEICDAKTICTLMRAYKL